MLLRLMLLLLLLAMTIRHFADRRGPNNRGWCPHAQLRHRPRDSLDGRELRGGAQDVAA